MIDALTEWARGAWGITVLIAIAWFGISCVFSVVLGRLMKQAASERVDGGPGKCRAAVKPIQRHRRALE